MIRRTVWIVNPFDNLPGEGFRPGRYELMARALAAAGHDVTWVTSDWSHAMKRLRTVPESVAPHVRLRLLPGHAIPYHRNVSFMRLVNHVFFAHEFARFARTEMASPAARPALVIVSVPPLSVGRQALALRRKFCFKLVADVQDAWPETFARLVPRGFKWTIPLLLAPLRRMARRIYRDADLVTGVCDSYESLVRAAGAVGYLRAYLGIAHQPQATPAHAHGESDGIRFAYVGSLGYGCDLATVIRAVNAIPRATLDVAGEHPPHVEGRVTYHGSLGEKALNSLLASCDIGVVPMRADSFVGIPNKVADYAAAGLPIVSSLDGECARLLARTHAGVFYTPGDADSLVCAALKARQLNSEGAANLLRELDAKRIYRDYVQAILRLVQ